MTTDHRLVYLLNVGHRRLQRWTQSRTSFGGVTAAQSGLLFYLEKNDGALMSEAAAALDLGASGLSGLADRMEHAALLAREVDEADRRVWRLRLTAKGRSAVKRSRDGLVDLNARLTEGFSKAEIDVVARWLSRLQDKFPSAEGDKGLE
ncbi:MarR family winged helix-turn-helix transcriptional regulator [Cupriavidus sp. 8B]